MVPKLPRAFMLEDILTEDEIALALRLYRGKRKFYKACLDKIVLPNLERIMDVVGSCDPRYVVYGIEYRCLKMRKNRGVRKQISTFWNTHVTQRARGRPKVYDGELDRSLWQ